MAEAFDPNDVEKFLPAIGAIAARVGGSAVVQGAKKVAVEGAKRAKKVAAAGAEAAKTGAGKVAEKATQAASAAKEGIKAAPGKAKELREAAQQSGAGKKFNAALEQAKEFKESDKYKNLQAAKEQVDAQRQRAQQQKDAQVERASQAARGAASTGQAFNKAWDALRKEVVDVSGQHAEVGDPRFWNVMSEFGTRDPKTIGQEFAPYDIDELTALAPQVDELLASYGYTPYYFGGRFPMPDLSKRNYNTGHLAIFDPGVREAGFVDPDFTDNWRKVHELGHALGYEDLNAQWGEGRRLGKLGVRTPREMLRAVDWESRALQNQRKLMDEIGLNVKPEQYNRDWNTTIGDAGYRAITGKFTSPEQEGFVPFSDRRVPVDVAMQKVRDRAEELGLDMDQTLRDKRGGARKIASEPMDLAWRLLKASRSPRSNIGYMHLPNELNMASVGSYLESNPSATIGDLVSPYFQGQFLNPSSDVETNPPSYQGNPNFPLTAEESQRLSALVQNEQGYQIPKTFYSRNVPHVQQDQQMLQNAVRVLHGRLRQNPQFDVQVPEDRVRYEQGAQLGERPTGRLARANQRMETYLNSPVVYNPDVSLSTENPIGQVPVPGMVQTGEPMDLAWRMLKMGEEYHPSVEAHMEARQGRYKPVSRMPRTDEPEVSTDEGIDYKTRGQGAIPQGEPIREVTRPLGELHSSFMPVGGHAHERVTDADRVVDAKEQQEVQDRIMQEMAKYVDSNGMYHPDVPREFAIRTHVFDHYRQPDPFYSKSNGDSIVGIVRPHPDNPRRPQVHTVMLRRTGQPLTKDKLRVQKVIDAAPKKSKVRKSVLIKERKSPEAMRHKREYDAAYNKRPDQVKYREELNRERRRRGIMGSHDHMDVSHTQGGRLTLEPEHSNRARHFKEKGTLRVMKSIRDDIEMLRNLLGGPLDEQDGKIAQAMLGMMDEREAMEAEEKPPTLGHAHFDHHGFS